MNLGDLQSEELLSGELVESKDDEQVDDGISDEYDEDTEDSIDEDSSEDTLTSEGEVTIVGAVPMRDVCCFELMEKNQLTGKVTACRRKVEALVRSAFRSKEPRDHQVDAACCCICDVLNNLVTSGEKWKADQKCHAKNKNYLFQHAAGSGKSLTIACLVCVFAHLKVPSREEGKMTDLFEKIVVVNDRTHLDCQLGDTVIELLEENGFTDFKRAKSNISLQEALKTKRVVITTLQKFGHRGHGATETYKEGKEKGLVLLENVPTAVFNDEAHRSYGASQTRSMHELMTGKTYQMDTVSYFSFTSTPSRSSLEMFGDRTKERGFIHPFHTFSFTQAIQAGHIINFVKNFAEMPMNISLEQKDRFLTEEKDVEIPDGRRAAMRLVDEAFKHAPLVKEKAAFVVRNLTEYIHKLDTPRLCICAMLVVRSRKHVIWYSRLIRDMVKEILPPNQQFGVIAAFSPFTFEGKKMTERDEGANGEMSKYWNAKYGIVNALHVPEANVRLIVVADKLQTGFDEKRLCCLYVDKPLVGQSAVQTLGRLSRTADDKNEVYIIDFVNKRGTIQEALSLFWEETVMRIPPPAEKMREKLSRLRLDLEHIPGFKERDINTFLAAVPEQEQHNKTNKTPTVYQKLRVFIKLCDRLQIGEFESIPVAFVKLARFKLRELAKLSSVSMEDRLRLLTNSLSARVDIGGQIAYGCLSTHRGRRLSYELPREQFGDSSSMNFSEVVSLANDILGQKGIPFRKLYTQLTPGQGPSIESVLGLKETYTKGDIEFAQSVFDGAQVETSKLEVDSVRQNLFRSLLSDSADDFESMIMKLLKLCRDKSYNEICRISEIMVMVFTDSSDVNERSTKKFLQEGGQDLIIRLFTHGHSCGSKLLCCLSKVLKERDFHRVCEQVFFDDRVHEYMSLCFEQTCDELTWLTQTSSLLDVLEPLFNSCGCANRLMQFMIKNPDAFNRSHAELFAFATSLEGVPLPKEGLISEFVRTVNTITTEDVLVHVIRGMINLVERHPTLHKEFTGLDIQRFFVTYHSHTGIRVGLGTLVQRLKTLEKPGLPDDATKLEETRDTNVKDNKHVFTPIIPNKRRKKSVETPSYK